MKKIMIDLDDVIVDHSGYLELVNQFLNTNHVIEDVKGFYIQDLVPEAKKEEFTEFFISKNIYDYSEIFPNCIKVIKELKEKYEVYICSTYVFRDHLLYSGDALKYKFEFLVKNFPFLDPNRFTFHTNKSILNCEIKIDDRIENLENAEIKILYDSYHNKAISDKELKERNVIRANNWKEIRDILL